MDLTTYFQRGLRRRHTDSVKWDGQGGDYIPLWVADMDFPVAEPIIEALQTRMEHPVFGYTMPGTGVYDAITGYYKRQYGVEVKKEWILFLQGVNIANNIAARTLGGTILVNTPMYPHINRKLPEEAGKPVIRVPLKGPEEQFTFDFEALERAVTPAVTTLILCNPHNPTGRVFTREELTGLLDFAKRHGIILVSDEIHSDLILDGEHIPAFAISGEAADHVIVHHSATKTYNIPGLPLSFAVIPNERLRNAYKRQADLVTSPIGTLSYTALEAAFTKGEAWRRQLLEYLRDNREFLRLRISGLDGLEFYPGQATYLGWIDAGGMGLGNPREYFLEHAGVNFSDGAPFSAEGFLRVNFGCPRAQLEEAFARVERAVSA